MKKIKEGIAINSVIIQEGVPTIDIFKSSSAEPLIYYIGDTPNVTYTDVIAGKMYILA